MSNNNILIANVYDPVFTEKFLLVGTCLPNMYPEIFKEFASEWRNIRTYCLEQSHYNMLVAKLVDILAIGKTKKVGFLTVDGSPHCTQMHFASKYLKRILKNQDIEFQHFVVDKSGKIFEVSIDAINTAKNLANVGVEVK